MSDITVEVPAGRDLTLDAASPVEVALDVGVSMTVELGTAQGPAGPPGAAQATYVHNQPVAAMVWTIDHGLGFWPDVIVFDASGEEVKGAATNPTLNRTTLTFSTAIAGVARLS